MTYKPEGPVRIALHSLAAEWDLNTPHEIHTGQHAAKVSYDRDDYEHGLRELANNGLAEEDKPGHWRLTYHGREVAGVS